MAAVYPAGPLPIINVFTFSIILLLLFYYDFVMILQ
jgi:hypothetical protein